MDIRSNWSQYVVVAVVILLTVAGYMTLSNLGSLDELNEKVADLLAELGTEPTESRSAEAAAFAEGAPTGEVTQEAEETSTTTPTPPPKYIQVAFPGQGSPLVLSNIHPQIEIRLKAIGKDFSGVVVWLTLVREVKGEEEKTALEPGLSNTSVSPEEISIAENEWQNVTLGFDEDQLPGSGTYEGWLVITAKDSMPTSQLVTVDIVRPAIALQHRLSGDSTGAIELRGVRTFWSNFRFVPDKVAWETYSLRLWEQNLQEGVDFRLLSSELADPKTGQAGYLSTVDSGMTGLKPVAITLKPEGIYLPGTYEGWLTLFPGNGGTSDKLKVKAYVRDSLWWPFIVIALGALAAQWLLRAGAKVASASVPYQGLLIRAAEKRLRTSDACEPGNPNPKCEQLKRELEFAEHALQIGDLNKAATLIDKVESAITQLNAAPLYLKQRKAAIDALKHKYDRPPLESEQVQEVLCEAYELLDIGKDFLGAGFLTEMNQALEKIPAALKTAEDRLKQILQELEAREELREVDVSREELREVDVWIEYRKVSPRNGVFRDFTRAPYPTFCIGDEIKFKVVTDGQDSETSYRWKMDWVRLRWFDKRIVPDERSTKKSTFTHSFEAGSEENYPRHYRIQAFDGKATIALDFVVKHRYQVEISPEVVYAGDVPEFSLKPAPSKVDDVKWFVDGEAREGPTPLERGEHRVTAKIEGKWVASRDLTVYQEPFEKASRRFNIYARLIPLAWAFAAAVAGLVYIDARLPTFGSRLDYILALAWGLGVGTTVAPKENLGDAIKKAMGITQREPEKPAEQPAAEEPAAEKPTQIPVPDLKGKTLAEVQNLYKGIFEFKKRPDNAKDSWVIREHQPEAGKEAAPKSTIALTLEEPPQGQ